MKKKVIASILAASMAAMALTGCGGGKTTSEAQGATTDETTASAEAGSTADGEEAPDLNQDTKGTTITFWHSMGGVNGEAMGYLVNNSMKRIPMALPLRRFIRENMMIRLTN